MREKARHWVAKIVNNDCERNVSSHNSVKIVRLGKIENQKALTCLFHEDGNDHAVHAQYTSHNDGNDRFEDELGLEDSDRDDTDARLCGAEGWAHVGEYESKDDAHDTKENSLVGIADHCIKTNNQG